jgi:hypothetical protein
LSQTDSIYDVAISYSSKERSQADYVAAFNEEVERRGFSSFFDKQKKAQIWGEHLPENLYEIYRRKSKWCVMFISRDYVVGVYPNLERKAILDRQIKSRRYVLPVRFDNSVVPGLSEGIAYVWAKDYAPVELAALFEERYFTEL